MNSNQKAEDRRQKEEGRNIGTLECWNTGMMEEGVVSCGLRVQKTKNCGVRPAILQFKGLDD